MAYKEKTYSNRQVKGTEDLFGADDPDAALVGGSNQPGFGANANLVINNAVDGVSANIGGVGNENSGDEDEESEDAEAAEAAEGPEPYEKIKPGIVTNVTFTQVNKFTPNGTFLADVIAEIEDVKGARDYEIKYYKIS